MIVSYVLVTLFIFIHLYSVILIYTQLVHPDRQSLKSTCYGRRKNIYVQPKTVWTIKNAIFQKSYLSGRLRDNSYLYAKFQPDPSSGVRAE